MPQVSPADAASYAGNVFGYCLVLVFVAAIPYGIGFLFMAGPRSGGGSLFVFALLQILAYAILLAGVVGLLYKVVADGVALANGNGDAVSKSPDPEM